MKDPFPSDSPGDEPTSGLNEPWYPPDDSKKSPDDNEDKSNRTPSFRDVLLGGVIMVGSGILLAWLVGNDVTGVGVGDDAAIGPAAGAFTYGMGLAFGY